jgi:hypothetical protein
MALIAIMTGCSDEDENPVTPHDHVDDFSADVAVDWFNLSTKLVKGQSMTPPAASRMFGYAGVTLYEALVPGMTGYNSLVGQLNGLDALAKTSHEAPLAEDEEYHWPTVANSASATFFRFFFANGSQATLDSIDNLEAQYDALYSGTIDADVYDRSVRRGRLIAADIFTWSLSDGYATYNNCAFTPPVGAGLWVPTPPAFAAPIQPCWGDLRTFVLTDGSQCNPAAPPAFSTDTSSAFGREMMEVFYSDDTMNTAMQNIALFWADGGGTITPPGHWISIAGQVLDLESATLDQAAETYAAVGIAVADAFISCWYTKFDYNYLRPVTCIRDQIDAGWLSYITTPPFAEYTSGHSTQSGAATEVLTAIFGDNYAFTDHTHDATYTARSFGSFYEAADEAAISRLYGGIHFRSAIDIGVTQGHCIGQQVLALNFKN